MYNFIVISSIGRRTGLLWPFIKMTGLFTILVLSLLVPAHLFAQSKQGKLNIDLDNAPVSELIRLIKEQTEYSINYNPDVIKTGTRISVHLKQATVSEVFRKALRGTGYDFVMDGNAILIIKAKSKGTVRGNVVDEENGEIIPGATIKIGSGTLIADMSGAYTIQLPEGIYEAEISNAGYGTKRVAGITITSNEVVTLDLLLRRGKGDLETVVVKTSANKEGTSSLLLRQKNNIAISDGISGELIRRTPDRNAGEAIKRITGVSVIENKYVVVRGLADKYNYTLLNGGILPSTEPDRRTFSLDLIPSQAIENIVVTKTATADLPGEFAGGVVMINTKDFPEKDFLTLSVGSGFYEGQTGKAFIKDQTGKTDWQGRDDGSRAIPVVLDLTSKEMNKLYIEERFKLSEALSKNWTPVAAGNAQPIKQLQASYGKTFNFKQDAKLGIVALVSYRKDQTIDQVERYDIARYVGSTQLPTDTLKFLRSYKDEKDYHYLVNEGAMLNITYQFGKNKVSLKNMVNRDFETVTTIKTGEKVAFDNDNEIVPNLVYNMHPVQKTLIGTQLQGEHRFGMQSPVTLTWNVSYNTVKKYEPGETRNSYINAHQYYSVPDSYSPEFGSPNTSSRVYSDLKEDAYNVNFAVSTPFKIAGQQQVFKAGAFTQFKKRHFYTRTLGYFDAGRGIIDPSTNNGYPTSYQVDFGEPIESILTPKNFRPGGLVAITYELPANLYEGGSNLASAFVNMESNLLKNLKLVYGARVEFYTMSLSTSKDLSRRLPGSGGSGDDQSPIDYIRYNTDVLPSLNLIYSPVPSVNLRAAYYKTLTRPLFREISPQAYFDNVSGYITQGNPLLERGTIKNMDLRAEWYPAAGELFSATLFKKELTDPVEMNTTSTSGWEFLRYYINTPKATNWGYELEFRKSLYFGAGPSWLRNIILFGNYSRIHSETSNTLQVAYETGTKKRPLSGQSPYLVNAGILVNMFKNTFSFSAAFNKAGKRIVVVGTTLNELSDLVAYPDVYENPRNQLDLQVSQRLFKRRLEIKINASNLINDPFVHYQDFNRDNKYSGKPFDAPVYLKKSFSSYTCTLTYNFK